MAWNEPGGGDKDPWGNRGGNNDGPPDLDEALKKLQEKLGGIFGGKSGGRGNGNGGSGKGFSVLLIGAIVVATLFYGVAGFYQVDAKERAVVLRLGAFNVIKQPGLHWNAPLITEVFVENVTEERQYSSRGLMLTEDESIVELPLTVQYNVDDVKTYVLNVREPDVSLRHATDSALRHVVGSSELEEVLSAGREEIAAEVKSRLQEYLESYGTGIFVRSVNIQEARPPEQVRDAFDDVINAKEDEERLKNEAQAYANSVVPAARGQAQRMLEEAEAYKAEVVSRAEGESERFTNLLVEYKKAPEVTRQRLYIEAVEAVMGNASKVMVDVDGGNNMMYLPIDKLMENHSGGQNRGNATLTQEQLRQISDYVARQLGRNNNTYREGR
ncbi:FtsH protease activity modulator HflK [Gilvimarinus agarilyticus]|uniref:FtsH protease activity modulator HflK n=1 Tax=unclassified Gilvimarinus TaxID=2642066 RepID=UPI001C0902FE|nr:MULTISPECIES: FtsH protease activity modulator HflK [unclassified Gilvimarinus]MBU2886663.1 FtsH protease activity modulator HflK [Gilvimarinus agarilyticus]MDO6571331.1 FtsH protease activity modulator HflK [Gilvimarinus sp. 2_MG-2023]MDO6746252.1 FtsH protease activity modulator HflK [Gilvimarinus sp. 1_MG-2023]